MPEPTDAQRQAAIDELRRRRQGISLRELIIRIIAEAEGEKVNGQLGTTTRE
ncbi:MAG: hypothetical protein ACR2RF_26290 [Geminicoccaceae bacterium]